MSIHVLHITNDFGGTEVYRNLYQHLDDLGVKQTVFVPLNPRVRYREGNHDFVFKTKGSQIVYSFVQKKYHRYLYDNKINIVLKDLERKVNLKEVSLIHSGTLCMTGAVAYEVYKKYGIPYITAVRNTDINTYFKRMWWKRSYFHSILEKASQIVFISPQYKENCFKNIFSDDVVRKIQDKISIIPNGIDQYYLSNRKSESKTINSPIEIVYAAGFKSNKNLVSLIRATEKLRDKGHNLNLTAIGKSLPNRKVSNAYLELIDKEARGKDYIELLHYQSKSELCETYKNMDIFVMPSIHETFGLSYAEALSQGLPIIYTKGQGFDGFYKDGEVGFSVNALDIDDVAFGIENIIKDYDRIANNVANLDLNKDFNWENISKRYHSLYNSILK